LREHRRVQLTRFIGLLFALAGFGAIGIGWNRMASVSCVDCQLPYLLSGGAAGLGLVLVGVGLLLVAQLRAERSRIVRHVDAVRDAIWDALQSMETEKDVPADAGEAPNRPKAGPGPPPPDDGHPLDLAPWH
jgi:hypothetical protein